MCRIPFLQILLRASEIVQRDHLVAFQTGFVLCLERALEQVLRLGVIAHAIVGDGNAVERGQRVLRHLLLFEQALCTP